MPADPSTSGSAAANQEAHERIRAWVDKFRPALQLALEEFIATAEWPARERLRRKLVQLALDNISLDELFRDMPKSAWESRQFPPDRIVLSFQVLHEMPEAQPLLAICIAIIQRAYALYRSDQADELVIRSDDASLTEAASGNVHLLLCAREVLDQHPPGPLAGGSAGIDSTEWTRTLNAAAIPAFKNIAGLDDYLAAQERIINDDPYRQIRLPVQPHKLWPQTMPQAAGSDVQSSSLDLFVVMPFTQTWSDSVYAFIRRAVERLKGEQGMLHLYRADEIAEPGQISQQVKDSIASAHVILADITAVNPNVMWELGYADGLGKTIVILNQNPQSSPFDMIDRRQVAYHNPPTDTDEENFLRHIMEAIQIAGGPSFQAQDEGF